MTVAESQGVGVRVIKDGRQGFAYAGTLEKSELLEVCVKLATTLGFPVPRSSLG